MIKGQVVVEKIQSRRPTLSPKKLDVNIPALMNSPMMPTNNLSKENSIAQSTLETAADQLNSKLDEQE